MMFNDIDILHILVKEKIHEKSKLYEMISKIDFKGVKSFVTDEEYKKFVTEELLNIINMYDNVTNENEIVSAYYSYLKNTTFSNTCCLLTFLRKYKLIDFYTYYYPGMVYSSHKEELIQQDIKSAYEKELAYANDNQNLLDELDSSKQLVMKKNNNYGL